jgi:diaminohydroxyphosphoribosylaminopyrimidine deaminase/5-amino-6-(5-phosphoribosylamino)uracil reductase
LFSYALFADLAVKVFKKMIDHENFIRQTLKLARKGIGKTATNPLVGAVLVHRSDGAIISIGYHTGFGEPHAEVEAIRRAKRLGFTDLSDTILYVNLEPCCHHGKTPPCTDLIIAEKIPHVVFGTKDPFPAVSGKGARILQNAGLKVEYGILAEECETLNKVFFKNVRSGLPWITLKMAQSLDGKIATVSGDSKWISSEASRKYVHILRSQYDAVLVGATTVIKDDPQLNVRLVKGRDPKPIVLDGRLRLPLTAKVLKNGAIVLTLKNSNRKKIEQLKRSGVTVYEFPQKKNGIDLKSAMRKLLKEQRISSILVEGGASVHGEFLKERLADDLIVFIAPKLIGHGLSSVGAKLAGTIKRALRAESMEVKKISGDLMITARLRR